jgi:hypothetical protein
MRMSYRALYVYLPLLALALALAWVVGQRVLDPGRRPVKVEAAEAVPAPVAASAGELEATTSPAALPAAENPRDLEIFQQKLAFARAERLDTLPIGEIIARLGVTFVGTDYVPHTLEVPGPERLVVNLRELDCVTFVENVLALSRLVRAGSTDFDDFRAELTRIRYRGGVLDGYPSRLHYFSEWIADNERKGLVRDITRELGGVPDPEPIRFMSTHVEAYRQLSDPANLEAIRRIEEELSARTRYYIPEDRIAEVAPRIRNGDIIAATSTLDGLDIAHTGVALWKDGELYLLHAPLVGRAVEISAVPLAERIKRIETQDGIMVARPL